MELQKKLVDSTFTKLKCLKQQQVLVDLLSILHQNSCTDQTKNKEVETIDLKLKQEQQKTQSLKLELVQLSKKIKDEQFKKTLFSSKYNDILLENKAKDKKIQLKDEMITKLKDKLQSI